jgi:peptidoglycan/LPS O-acetylase OafA/YrhL
MRWDKFYCSLCFSLADCSLANSLLKTCLCFSWMPNPIIPRRSLKRLSLPKLFSTTHDKSADGLRGIASLIVVIAHFVCAFRPSLQSKFHPLVFASTPQPSLGEILAQLPPFSLSFNGHFAVCIFFVLSGYVLSIPFFSNDKTRLRERIIGRYLRLNIPIAFAILLSYSLFKANLYSNVESGISSGSNWMKSWFPPAEINLANAVQDSTFSALFYGDGSFIPQLWTLKIEFVGSLILLTYLLVTSPRSQQITAPIYILVLILLFKHDALYHLLLLLGSFLNFLKPLSGHLRSALLGLSLFLGSYSLGFPYHMISALSEGNAHPVSVFVLFHGLGALILVHCVRSGSLRSLLESPPLLFLGRISFPLYLYHHMVLCSLASFIYIYLPKSQMHLVVTFVVYLAVSILLSWAVFSHVDELGIRVSRAFTKAVLKKSDHTPDALSGF